MGRMEWSFARSWKHTKFIRQNILMDSIAELLPNDLFKRKQELINKAIDSAYKLPSFLDTVERIGMIFLHYIGKA